MNFKVGDKVRVKDDLVGNIDYNSLFFAPQMEEYKGEEFLISKIKDSRYYNLETVKDENGFSWCFNDAMLEPASSNQVESPQHYGGAENPYEAIKVIEAWNLGFNLGNVAKYISRAGKKDPTKHIEDLKKAQYYLAREINNLEKK